jgi:hypothetical protein
MMQKLFLLLLAVMLLACQNVVRPDKPNDLISEDQMADIFYDAYLANAAKSINNKKLRQMGIRLDSIIYQKHGIDSTQFAHSNEYYSLDLDNYAEIYSKVEARLLVDQKRLDSIKDANDVKKRGKNAKASKSKDSLSKQPISKDPQKLDSMIKKKMSSLIEPIESEEETGSNN